MKISVDLGASQTRFMNTVGGEVNTIPNRYTLEDNGKDIMLGKVSDNIQDNLDISIARITDLDGDKYFPVRVLMGDFAARHSARLRQPQALESKHLQPINYYSILTALAIQVRKVRKDLTKTEKVELYLALPPVEVRATKAVKYISDILKGRFIVGFNVDKVKVDLHITKIHLLEESRLACMAYSFNTDLTPTQLGKDIYNDKKTVLSVDIGASTTDLGIIKNASYRETSGGTIKKGGNFIAVELRQLVEQEHGFQPSVEDIATAVTTGKLKKGDKVLDVAGLLTQSKIKCASEMMADIEEYFTLQGISPNSIEVMLVSGGGSMASYVEGDEGKIETTKPLTYFLEREIKKLSDVRVEYLSDNPNINPREANIKGLSMKAKFDQVLLEKSAKVSDSKSVSGK
jgi:hypothetical protein